MAQTKYYISHDGKDVGPFELPEIAKKMQSGEFSMTDYIYLEQKEDWATCLEFEPLVQLVKSSQPKAPSKPAPHRPKTTMTVEPNTAAAIPITPATAGANGEEWYVLKWDNRHGPFGYPEILRMLQDKSLFGFDYIWKAGMESWKRLAETEEFSSAKIKGLSKSDKTNFTETFFRRRHLRSKFDGSLIVHDNKNVWKGQSFEISEGGAGVIMYNSMVLPGQTLFLHFQPGEGVPAFNAICEVVSKKYVRGIKDRSAPIHYGIKFLKIHPSSQDAIRGFIQKQDAEAS